MSRRNLMDNASTNPLEVPACPGCYVDLARTSRALQKRISILGRRKIKEKDVRERSIRTARGQPAR